MNIKRIPRRPPERIYWVGSNYSMDKNFGFPVLIDRFVGEMPQKGNQKHYERWTMFGNHDLVEIWHDLYATALE